ncbi:MAG: mechanosensitive ion channel family protein [Verrucomicrobia subdivision 3 bacterium]|nr:mechanosensitive ion channel family protein [Limisphaerales bacterium]
MDFWNVHILPRLSAVEVIEWFTFAVNILVYLFSKNIASRYGAIQEEARMNSRLRILHGFNLIVFITFILSVAIHSTRFPAEQISQTCLTLLCAYLVTNLAEVLLLKRYGKATPVMGFTRRVETATSRTLELLAHFIILVGAVVVLVNVWGLTSSLQTTGVLGFLALLVFITKDYWMRDFLSGILLISSERIERGDVIAIPAEDVLGIVLDIRARQTHVRDLVHGHDMMLPNAFLLTHRVDLYKQNTGGPFKDYVDFKIAYGTPVTTVHDFLQAVHQQAATAGEGMDANQDTHIALKENGDHAARWRLGYVLNTPEKLLAVRDAVNLAAYELQEKFGLDISTPTTHRVESRSGNLASTSSSVERTKSPDKS